MYENFEFLSNSFIFIVKFRKIHFELTKHDSTLFINIKFSI